MNKEQAEKLVETYLKAVSDTDVDAIMELYAQECTVEDPVGGDIQENRKQVVAFYENLKGLKIEAKSTGPARVTDAGNSIAFPFQLNVDLDGTILQQDIIDIFYCDDENKITRMQAFWGSENATME